MCVCVYVYLFRVEKLSHEKQCLKESHEKDERV